MPDRFPGYDVLAKWDTVSWNEPTRRAVGARLAVADQPVFLDPDSFATLRAVCDRIVPQAAHGGPGRSPIPVAGLVDHKLRVDQRDGYRQADMPSEREAWRRGLAALDAEAMQAHGAAFRALDPAAQDALLQAMQRGELTDPAWGGMSCKTFFETRMVRDIVHAYYAHPTAWSEIGFGGPASPRGYVRMDFNRRDAWEAAEVKGGDEHAARRENRRVG